MTKSITAIGFNFSADQSDLIEQKLKRIAYADQHITDFILKVKLEKEYKFNATINFHWGTVAHCETTNYEFGNGLDALMDQLDVKIKKEKDKVQNR